MGMRVLFTTPAGLGHIYPTVPLAQAMSARGHDVLWAVPPDGLHNVTAVGIPAAAVGAAGLMNIAEVQRQFPELTSLSPAERPKVMFGKLFGAVGAPSILADLLPLAQSWRPDLIVADAGDFAGHIVGAELGVPSVTKAFGPLLPAPRLVAAAHEVAPLWRSRGLEPRPYGGAYDHLYLDIFPPALQPQDEPHVPRRQLLRPVTYAGPTSLSEPAPLPDGSDDTSLVYVTMGTVFNGPDLLNTVIGAIADLDVRVLATAGPMIDPATLPPRGPNVRVERYVPQTSVLPHASVVVSHGGSGTVIATLEHGTPQLCLPQGADQFLNAEAVVASGAGLALMPGAATTDAIRDAVTRLLLEESFGAAARDVSASIESMPTPEEVATTLEELRR